MRVRNSCAHLKIFNFNFKKPGEGSCHSINIFVVVSDSGYSELSVVSEEKTSSSEIEATYSLRR